jgi:GGDEF domain-containing protein
MVLQVVFVLAFLALGGFAAHASRSRRDLEAEVAALRQQARVERLTMLRNGTAFKEDLDLELLRAERTGQPVCLVILSLEPGPRTEQPDAAQHQALADAMSSAVRLIDVGYRIGTDEFALILSPARAQGALLAASRVREALLATVAAPGRLTAGIAEAGPGIDRRHLFRNAYVALLAAGRQRRADMLVYSPELEPMGATADSPARLLADA